MKKIINNYLKTGTMKTYRIIPLATVLLLSQCAAPDQKQAETMQGTTTSTPIEGGQASVVDDESANNIVQIAVGSPDHTTLVAAVQAAGLVDVLANNGPLTVCAPTNEAFAQLPEGTVENLLKPENKTSLIKLIHYHASPGTYKGELLKDGMMLYQAQGDKVQVERHEDGSVTIGGAKILATVEATNGVVHVVDKVLLPPEKK